MRSVLLSMTVAAALFVANEASATDYGIFTCSSKPIGAEVFVDGVKLRHLTPIPKFQDVRMSVGQHVVVFKFEGRSSEPKPFVITANSITLVLGEIPDQ